MTRKRFIKLLMAHGYSRNAAHSCAWYVQSTGMPYTKAYGEMRMGLAYIHAATIARRAVSQIVSGVMQWMDEISETFMRFAGDVRTAFDEVFGVHVETDTEEGDET